MKQPVRYSEPKRGRPDRLFEMCSIDWSYWMRSCGLVGSGGDVPRLLSTEPVPGDLARLVFKLPDGMEPASIHSKLDALAQSSGGFLHIDNGPEAGQITFTAGQKDPLDKTYFFRDYRSQVLKHPRRGHPDPNWCVGVGVDGEPIRYRWESGETPHLLIAGSTGGGKSQIVNSMLAQMLHNNDPADLQLWMLEPKNELQMFERCPHVRRFLDGNVTDMNLHESAALMLEAARDEMESRYEAFAIHPKKPKKLT